MRTGGLRLCIVRGLFAATCSWLAVVAPALGAERSKVGHGAAANRQAAAADAVRLLGRLTLPAGAVSSLQEPGGDRHVLAGQPTRPVTPLLVDRQGWWRVTAPPDQVLGFINAHPPAGAKLFFSGAAAIPGTPGFQYVGFSWPARPEVLGTSWLVVTVVGLSDGSTGVRADADVVWIRPRSASERVPRGVKEIAITRGGPGRVPSLSLRVTDRSKVRKIIGMIDRLPTIQPTAILCPSMIRGTSVVTFSFLSGSGGRALATASELASVFEPTTSCDPLSFSIRGRPQTPQLRGAVFLRRVQRLLGVKLASSP